MFFQYLWYSCNGQVQDQSGIIQPRQFFVSSFERFLGAIGAQLF